MKDESAYLQAKQVFIEYLSKSHCRKTMERYVILEQVFMLNGHFTAEMLYNKINEQHRISLPTTYNTLELLEACGLIIKHAFNNQTAQYEKTCEMPHHHLVCTRCGRVTEFTNKHIKSAIMAKSFANFNVTSYSLYVYGQCKRCKKSC